MVRTDLALEAKESVSENEAGLYGVNVEEDFNPETNIRVTKVIIDTKNAAKVLEKPMGHYITIEAPNMVEPDEDYHREISRALAIQLRTMMPEEELSVLVVGLGNRDVTADALGPHVVDNLFVTRHVVKTYGKAAFQNGAVNSVSCVEPGVTARTGMDAAEIIKGVVEETKPNLLVVIDALAARSTKRLNRTIQITNTGIQPGSGVGNHRSPLTKESMGIPVIAIGVPTVVDAATIVVDALGQNPKSLGEEFCFGELSNMYVTSKDIDGVIKRLSFTISEGLNLALDPGELSEVE
ncbi:MAG: GPR endopeptidase [Lachnospiraceae bacterium]|nr:GPR endopeptidase [Lachnospiraceae bacterium]